MKIKMVLCGALLDPETSSGWQDFCKELFQDDTVGVQGDGVFRLQSVLPFSIIKSCKAHKLSPKPRYLRISKTGKLLKKTPSINFKRVKTIVTHNGIRKIFFRLSKVPNFNML